MHDDLQGIEVYKLNVWTQGPAMLQALNILENVDLKAMGYNSARYIHTLYQAMNLAFADRDFYYGDPYFPPEEPVQGLLSKEYAKSARAADRLANATTRTSSPAIPIRSRAARTRIATLLAEVAHAGAPRSRRSPDRSGRASFERRLLPRARRRSRRPTRRAGSSR